MVREHHFPELADTLAELEAAIDRARQLALDGHFGPDLDSLILRSHGLLDRLEDAIVGLPVLKRRDAMDTLSSAREQIKALHSIAPQSRGEDGVPPS